MVGHEPHFLQSIETRFLSWVSTICPKQETILSDCKTTTEKRGCECEMKYLVVAIFLVLLVQEKCFLVHVEAGNNGFITTRGTHFMLNGSPYFANGFNAYWLMYMGSDPSQRYKVSSAFRQATSHGLTVARTWAFSDGGYRPLQYAPGSYNEQMFKVYIFSFTMINKD